MSDPIRSYWDIRLAELREALEENDFDTYVAENAAHAASIVLEEIHPLIQPQSVSFGGSKSIAASGLYDAYKAMEGVTVLDTWDTSLSPEERYELRRQALLVDLYLASCNAVTEDGVLVNLDMQGNRVAATQFGPKNVVLVVGRNKIAPDLDSAMYRVKDYAAPVNAARLNKKTPCVKTGRCVDCKSPDRICNLWAITEKSFPAGRIKVVLVNEDLGF
ncbi:MAG: lactate utilization protein [Desulfovibrionaceae bacterium]